MFAPQTNPASPAVLANNPKIMLLMSSRDVLPLPRQLFPVYQLFLAVFGGCQKTLVLGFMSPLSRVGQRPELSYQKTLAIIAVSRRSIAAPIPPRAEAVSRRFSMSLFQGGGTQRTRV
jgi:hypothetical protein